MIKIRSMLIGTNTNIRKIKKQYFSNVELLWKNIKPNFTGEGSNSKLKMVENVGFRKDLVLLFSLSVNDLALFIQYSLICKL